MTPRTRHLRTALTALALAACSGASPVTPTGDASPTHDVSPTGDAATDAPMSPCNGACPVVRQLAGGNRFTCAALDDGTVRCWGENGSGQLGDGSTMTRTRPVAVAGLTGVAQVSAGYEHACALKRDGTVWCWGAGANGRLGNGATDNAAAPVQVSGLAQAVAVSAGYDHSCAITTDGRLFCWGRGSNLGTGSVSSSNVPVAVMAPAGATDVAAGRSTSAGNQPTSCAVVAAGAVRCWGDGSSGQLGNGARDSSMVPVEVRGLTGARRVVVGAVHACALLSDGTVRCWGAGSTGAVGPDGMDFTTAPVAVPGVTGAQGIAAGDDFTCALLAAGEVRCWGAGGSGQLGRGSLPPTGMGRLPAPAAVALTGATSVAAGAQHACAYLMDGSTRCWGSNFVGQLGVGTEGDNGPTPAPVRW
jgi:alpha-tubulin suppressor-like RCC1 family protein